MKQKDIKRLVKNGSAEDITFGDVTEIMQNGYTEIGISYGVYGMNGGLFRDNKTGNLYAITARSANLFRLA